MRLILRNAKVSAGAKFLSLKLTVREEATLGQKIATLQEPSCLVRTPPLITLGDDFRGVVRFVFAQTRFLKNSRFLLRTH